MCLFYYSSPLGALGFTLSVLPLQRGDVGTSSTFVFQASKPRQFSGRREESERIKYRVLDTDPKSRTIISDSPGILPCPPPNPVSPPPPWSRSPTTFPLLAHVAPRGTLPEVRYKYRIGIMSLGSEAKGNGKRRV
eukprot:Hpha_TRINITY_DN16676_c3_g1::TRINITY_DN16676_c3_g1_i2::g.182882::m.182882